MFIRYPHSRSTVPIRLLIPNLITTAALCSGLASIHYSLKGDWDRAMFAVLLSAVFDGLDGRAARMLKVSSPFGEVLDSLSDFLSFGVAPAILLHQWMLKDQSPWGLIAVLTFALCSALRLARFTAGVRPSAKKIPDTSSEALASDQAKSMIKAKFFVGLATPAAGAAALVPPMLMYSKHLGPIIRPWVGLVEPGKQPDGQARIVEPWFAAIVIVYTLVIAMWMVSRIPMFSFKKMRVGQNAVVPILIGVGLAAAIAVTDIWLLVPALVALYLGMTPLSIRSYRALHRLVLPESVKPE